MKKVRFIYNPYSGENSIINELDSVIRLHQEVNLTVVPYRIQMGRPLSEALDIVDDTYEYVLVAGGDGTVDSVVNAMKERNIDIPIGILPVGTANDFGKFINMPSDIQEACKQILDSYFVNVASSGLFTDVSQKTDINLKNTIGKLAYYLKGLEELPNFRRLKIKLESKECTYDDDMYLILVFNGKTAGNFNLATQAEVDDGKLDVIIFKAVAIIELLPLFIKMLKGEHLDSDKVVYFKTDDLYIESDEDIVTDIDGEKGPDFPLRIQCIKGGIKLLGIKEDIQ